MKIPRAHVENVENIMLYFNSASKLVDIQAKNSTVHLSTLI